MNDTLEKSKRVRDGVIKPAATKSRGVFEDLGIPNAGIEQHKVCLAIEVNQALARVGATQADRALVLGVAQPVVSNLERFELGGFSIERLLRYADHLGITFELTKVEAPSSRRSGR